MEKKTFLITLPNELANYFERKAKLLSISRKAMIIIALLKIKELEEETSNRNN